MLCSSLRCDLNLSPAPVCQLSAGGSRYLHSKTAFNPVCKAQHENWSQCSPRSSLHRGEFDAASSGVGTRGLDLDGLKSPASWPPFSGPAELLLQLLPPCRFPPIASPPQTAFVRDLPAPSGWITGRQLLRSMSPPQSSQLCQSPSHRSLSQLGSVTVMIHHTQLRDSCLVTGKAEPACHEELASLGGA